MKIISKYKDYYDYLTGIYGVDPKLILDRREGKVMSYKPSFSTKISIYIGGYLIEGYYHDGSFYYGDDLEQFKTRERFDSNKDIIYISKVGHINKNIIVDVENINKKENCAILLKVVRDKYEKYIRLSDYDINKLISAEEVYQILVDFLSNQIDEKLDIKSDLTDVEKIINKGFCEKRSFRPFIK